MNLQFKDTQVEIQSLTISPTYEGCIECIPIHRSRRLLMKDYDMMIRPEKGFVLLDENGIVDPALLAAKEQFDDEDWLSNNIKAIKSYSPYIKADNPPFIMLGKYVIELKVMKDYEYYLTIKWYSSEGIDYTRPLKEVLEDKTREIDFLQYSEFRDLDNW